ncbi:MAG: KEOPS complex subunit Pcc1 [Candidatus Micrarchaeales archaeon]
MYGATLKLNLGDKAKEYFGLLDKKVKFKRSTIHFKLGKGFILIEVKAADHTALIASTNSVLKQIRIIGNTETLFE